MIIIKEKGVSLNLDGRELKALLHFRGKTNDSRKIVFRVEGSDVIATARNGVGAALYIRGTSLVGEDHTWELDATPLTQIKFDLCFGRHVVNRYQIFT